MTGEAPVDPVESSHLEQLLRRAIDEGLVRPPLIHHPIGGHERSTAARTVLEILNEDRGN
jgi:hypothetical protein